MSDSDSDFSDFTSSSSEDLDYILLENEAMKNKNYISETESQYSDEEFRSHFRVSREIATNLAARFEGSAHFNTQKNEFGKISSFDHILIFLWFAGHHSASFRDVADRFDITISSLWRIIERCIHFLSFDLSSESIKWPSAEEKVQIERFFRENGFPGVIGAIDGTHIKIDKPKTDPDSYLDRKHFFSIQACSRKILLDIF